MALQVTKEPMENRQLALTIEVEQERVEKELRKAARKAARDFRIPGFRKGKAPYSVVVQYVGLPALYQEFMDDLGQQVYQETLEQEEIEPYATASLEDIELEPMRYKLIVPLDPEIDLGDYRSLRVEPEEPTVTEEEIDERLSEYREQYAGWQDADRPSEYGDLMTIDVRSVLTETDDEEETVVLNEQEWEVTPDQENPMDPPGFDEALLGLTAGDEKEFDLSWPEDSQSIYAGKTAHFTIKVHQVQTYQDAEITDELAQSIGPDFETVEDLRNSVRETLLEEKQAEAEAAYLDKVLDALLEQSTLNYPPVVIEDQIDSMMNDFAQQVQRIGFDSLDAYFSAINQDEEEFRNSQREEATRIAERNLLISELINVEKLSVNDEEIEERVSEMFGGTEDADNEQMRNMLEMFRDGPGRSIIESQVLTQKALDLLTAVARGEDVPAPSDDADADATDDADESDDEEGVAEADADTEAETSEEADS